eukprot:46766-Pelagomonas_calceolata.AAC.1
MLNFCKAGEVHTYPCALHNARAARRTVGGGTLGCIAYSALHSLAWPPTCHACRWCSLLQYLLHGRSSVIDRSEIL